jgi:hypothetical protein
MMGESSRAVAEALPYIPPIAMPNRARIAKNWENVRAKPVESSKTMSKIRLAMNGYFRPYLSPRRPKIIAPTERSINVSVMPHVTSEGSFPNVSAMGVTVRETVKKSNAS